MSKTPDTSSPFMVDKSYNRKKEHHRAVEEIKSNMVTGQVKKSLRENKVQRKKELNAVQKSVKTSIELLEIATLLTKKTGKVSLKALKARNWLLTKLILVGIGGVAAYQKSTAYSDVTPQIGVVGQQHLVTEGKNKVIEEAIKQVSKEVSVENPKAETKEAVVVHAEAIERISPTTVEKVVTEFTELILPTLRTDVQKSELQKNFLHEVLYFSEENKKEVMESWVSENFYVPIYANKEKKQYTLIPETTRQILEAFDELVEVQFGHPNFLIYALGMMESELSPVVSNAGAYGMTQIVPEEMVSMYAGEKERKAKIEQVKQELLSPKRAPKATVKYTTKHLLNLLKLMRGSNLNNAANGISKERFTGYGKRVYQTEEVFLEYIQFRMTHKHASLVKKNAFFKKRGMGSLQQFAERYMIDFIAVYNKGYKGTLEKNIHSETAKLHSKFYAYFSLNSEFNKIKPLLSGEKKIDEAMLKQSYPKHYFENIATAVHAKKFPYEYTAKKDKEGKVDDTMWRRKKNVASMLDKTKFGWPIVEEVYNKLPK